MALFLDEFQSLWEAALKGLRSGVDQRIFTGRRTNLECQISNFEHLGNFVSRYFREILL